MADRLDFGRPLPRTQPRREPVADRLRGHSGFGEVMSQQFGLRLDGLRKPRLQDLRDPLMKLLSLALHQRVVKCVFEQGVLECVIALRRTPLLKQNFRLHQLGQFRLQGRLVERRDGGQQLVAEFATDRRGQLRQSRDRPRADRGGP